MNGLELARTLRAQANQHDFPMILMSGVESPIETGEAAALGFRRTLVKPIRHSHLFDAMMHTLVQPRLSTVAAPGDSAATKAQPKAAKSAKILLAEDIEVNQFVATEILSREGYTCDIVSTGREAVAAVSKKRYDLVLMDCQMPEMSGFEAAAAIRNMEREQDVAIRLPIIALTANAVKGDRERCLAAGMDDYLTKPLNPMKLIRTMESYLNTETDSARPETSTVPVGAPVSAADTAPVAPPAPADAAIDYESLLARCMGDVSLLGRLAQKFQAKSGETWNLLLAGFKAGNTAETARLAHGIKGAAANLSATKLADLAEQIEQLGKAGDLSTAETIVEKLGEELTRCHQELSKLAPQGSAPPSIAVAPK
jgi:Amt family ammonium transporter